MKFKINFKLTLIRHQTQLLLPLKLVFSLLLDLSPLLPHDQRRIDHDPKREHNHADDHLQKTADLKKLLAVVYAQEGHVDDVRMILVDVSFPGAE